MMFWKLILRLIINVPDIYFSAYARYICIQRIECQLLRFISTFAGKGPWIAKYWWYFIFCRLRLKEIENIENLYRFNYVGSVFVCYETFSANIFLSPGVRPGIVEKLHIAATVRTIILKQQWNFPYLSKYGQLRNTFSLRSWLKLMGDGKSLGLVRNFP